MPCARSRAYRRGVITHCVLGAERCGVTIYFDDHFYASGAVSADGLLLLIRMFIFIYQEMAMTYRDIYPHELCHLPSQLSSCVRSWQYRISVITYRDDYLHGSRPG